MPSPIGHLVAGYAVYRLAGRRAGAGASSPPRRLVPLGAALALSLLPDADSILGFATANLGRYHNNLTHSLVMGLAAALVALAAAWILDRPRTRWWFGLTLACYELHVLMDYVTFGRGVMLFWPFTAMRFRPPLLLFFGLHWSEGLVSPLHLWTLLNEALFAAAVLWAIRRFERRAAQRPAASATHPSRSAE